MLVMLLQVRLLPECHDDPMFLLCAGSGCAGLAAVLSADDMPNNSKILAAEVLKAFLLPPVPSKV